MEAENAQARDLWTKSTEYIQAYQTEEQIDEVIALLELQSGANLIDIGCGNGAFALAAASQYPHCNVWAFDPLESAIEECRKQASTKALRNIRTGVASANATPLPSGSVDRIIMRNVLHHVANPDDAFDEINRLLRPGGLLILETPCNSKDDSFGELISEIHMLMDNSHRRTYHRPENISTALASRGIAKQSAKCWPYPFTVGWKQVDLIEKYDAEEELFLRQLNADQWSIALTLVRFVGKKKESWQAHTADSPNIHV